MDKSCLVRMSCCLHLFLVLLTPFAQGRNQDEVVRYTITDSSTLRVHGTSTMHNFTIHAGDVLGRFQIRPAVVDGLSLQMIAENPMGTVTIPVEQLRGGNLLFNRDLQKALQANIYPDISYHLTSFLPVDTSGNGTDWLPITTEGQLTITRVTRTVRMQIEGRWNQQDQLEFKGTRLLSIFEFGIDPPTRLFGALQVRDTVEVDFHLYLRPEIPSDGGS